MLILLRLKNFGCLLLKKSKLCQVKNVHKDVQYTFGGKENVSDHLCIF